MYLITHRNMQSHCRLRDKIPVSSSVSVEHYHETQTLTVTEEDLLHHPWTNKDSAFIIPAKNISGFTCECIWD